MSDKAQTENWKKIVKPYTTPSLLKSWWQVTNTLIPYFFLWWLSYKVIGISYWLLLPLCFLNGLFMVRTFIIFHDCGHGSFFKSKILRTLVGYITGVLTFTPYWQWTKDHAGHHATSGNLNKRGMGDITTITVNEYKQMHWIEKFGYRLYRMPFVTFFVGPFYFFILKFRFFQKEDGPKEKRSVLITNMALVILIGALASLMGFKNFLIIQAGILLFSQPIGIFLFYVQHQYEDAYWEKNEKWNFYDASVRGSSYFKLPKVLQWFSGNIGFHHIHHLSHQIPNYNLEKCMNENEVFQNSKIITLSEGFSTLFLKLWDEDKKSMITWSEYKKLHASSVEERHISFIITRPS